MKTIMTETCLQVAGGCPVCPLVPGACVAAGLTSGATSFLSWGSFTHGFTTAIFLGFIGYYAYANLNPEPAHCSAH